jgi:hypothetical protein
MNKKNKNYTYAEELKELQQAKKDYEEKGKKALRTLISKFFELNPEVMYLYWIQYTPYFNDGEECTFRIGEMITIKLNNDLIEDRKQDLEDDPETDVVQFPVDKDGNKIIPSLQYFLENMRCDEIEFENMQEKLEMAVNPCSPEDYAEFFEIDSIYNSPFSQQMRNIKDILQEVIGDHVEVIVGKDLEIHTREYEHS